MSDFRRVFCVYHPQQFITNFCKDTNCLMPLCPSCIGSHNDYHDKSGFRANYLNIYDSLAEVQTLIYESLINLEQDKKRNDEVIYQIHNLTSVVHQKIVMAKNLAYNALERAFQELEKEVMYTLEKRHEETGIFSLAKAEKYQAQLVQGIHDLYEMTQNLKTERCLSSMIKFYSESQADVTAIHNQVSASLYTNESYVPMIEINEDLISSLTGTVSRFVQVHFSFPKQVQDRVIFKETAKYGMTNQPRRIPPAVIAMAPPPVPNRNLTPTKSRAVPVTVHQPPPPPPQYTKSQYQANPSFTGTVGSASPAMALRTPTPIRNHAQTVSPKKYNYLSNTSYDEQFESLSRKVKDMRKENQMLSKALKNF